MSSYTSWFFISESWGAAASQRAHLAICLQPHANKKKKIHFSFLFKLMLCAFHVFVEVGEYGSQTVFCFCFLFFAITTSSKDRRCLRPIGGDSCCPLVPGTQKLIYCRVCDLLVFCCCFLNGCCFSVSTCCWVLFLSASVDTDFIILRGSGSFL